MLIFFYLVQNLIAKYLKFPTINFKYKKFREPFLHTFIQRRSQESVDAGGQFFPQNLSI